MDFRGGSGDGKASRSVTGARDGREARRRKASPLGKALDFDDVAARAVAEARARGSRRRRREKKSVHAPAMVFGESGSVCACRVTGADEVASRDLVPHGWIARR